MGTTDKADDTPKKGHVHKHKFPFFSCAFSLDNALLSGNKSDGWDNNLDDVQEKIAAENGLERDAASNLEDPVKEVQEFDPNFLYTWQCNNKIVNGTIGNDKIGK